MRLDSQGMWYNIRGQVKLSIPQPTFNRWMRQVTSAPLGSHSFLATEELKVLRRKLDQVRMERDILKKAVAFFAKESG